jgi:hypothetical protein
MKDAKGHGSDARGGNGQFQSHTVGKGPLASKVNATAERLAMRAMTDRRKLNPNRNSIRNIPPPAMFADSSLAGKNIRMERTDMPVAHQRGVAAAVEGKTLAQASAAGTTPGMPTPKIRGTS